MRDMMEVARYIANRYYAQYGQAIDEMKLHKLMYFAQRESLIQTDEPLFDATFRGWKFGPVLRELRKQYPQLKQESAKPDAFREDEDGSFRAVMDRVFQNYAGKDSWSLSRLTHGELSWKNSRRGIPESQNSNAEMKLEDIREDAKRIKQRRESLSRMGLNP